MSKRHREMRSTGARSQGLLDQRGEETITNWEAEGDGRMGKAFERFP